MSRFAEGERLHLAAEAGAEISRALADEDASRVIAGCVARALDAWECDLYEYDPESRELTVTASWAVETAAADLEWVGTVLRLADRPGYLPVIDDGRCVALDVDDPHLDAADRAAMLGRGVVSALAVPLRLGDEGVVGCLTLAEKHGGRRFTAQDVELVLLLAGPAAVAVHNARLLRLQQEQNRYLASLLDTASAITSSVTLEDCLARICRIAADALRSEECVAYEYDPQRDAIVCRAFYGVRGTPPALDEAGVYPLDDY